MEVINGYEALRQNAAWIDLSSRGKIRASGEDRARLLHAMSTNNVQALPPGDALYAFFLNDKGRILADAHIYNLGDELFLDTEPETAAKLFEHLERYIIADDVTLTDQTAGWAAIGLEGPRSVEICRDLGLSLPTARVGIQPFNGGFIATVAASGSDGVRIFVPVGEKAAWIAKLEAAGAIEATTSEARIVRMENRVPRYGDEITERYLVQETQALHAVNFNKGCYLGQEIVERVRSRGQVHRLLKPIRIPHSTVPEPGTKLNVNGNAAGEIASAVYSPQLAEVIGFAYVRDDIVQQDTTMEITGSELPIAVYFR